MNIGIAGGGLIGRLLAWQLLRAGHTVTVFDAGPVNGELSAAYVAAAMLAPYSEAVTSGAEVFLLGREAVAQWQVLLADLQQDCGRRVTLQDTGSLVVAHGLDASSMEHFKRKLHSVVPDDPQVSALDRAGIEQLEPDLPRSFRKGLWLVGEGSLDNRALLAALYESILEGGGRWLAQSEVQSVSSGEIQLADTTERFDLTIDCRGLGAKPDWPEVRGVRGEILWVQAQDVQLSRPVRLMHPRYHMYITPKPGNIYVVGATEIESESRAPVTVRSQLELLSALYSVHSGFAEAHIVGSYARCRPALPNNMPEIHCGDGLMRINGLYRHGYLLAPEVLYSALGVIAGEVDLPFVKHLKAKAPVEY